MANGDAARINCGGGSLQLDDGTTWGPDRFFQAGGLATIREVPIEGTGDDSLYGSSRTFFNGNGPGAAYRIPLPAGHYHVELHFAETFRPSNTDRWRRTFDVSLEGSRVLRNYQPLARGFATADRYGVDVLVEDGTLDLKFRSRQGFPQISGIVIRALPPAAP